MKIVAWIVSTIAGVVVAPFLLAALIVAGVFVGAYRLFRWAELIAVYGGDEARRDYAEWHMR